MRFKFNIELLKTFSILYIFKAERMAKLLVRIESALPLHCYRTISFFIYFVIFAIKSQQRSLK